MIEDITARKQDEAVLRDWHGVVDPVTLFVATEPVDSRVRGYLTWDDPIGEGVFIDGRLEVYDTAFITDYMTSVSSPTRWQADADRRPGLEQRTGAPAATAVTNPATRPMKPRRGDT